MKFRGIIAAMTVALLFATGARANEGSCFKVIDVPANNGIPGMSQFELIPCDAMPVPEPSSLAILLPAFGLVALREWRRRRGT